MAQPERDIIMDAIQAAFEAIVNVGDPAADSGNSGDPVGMVVTSGGLYTGASSKTYTVEVQTGGASGTAEVSITDVVGDQTVTTGQSLNLGTDGATIRFDFTGDLVVGDKWTVYCDTYNYTVRKVFRARAIGVSVKQYPTIIIGRGLQDYDQVDGAMYSNRMRIYAEMWFEERDEDQMDDVLSKGLQDMERAMQLDISWGGVALETTLLRAEPEIPEPGRPHCAMSLEFEVQYKQVINPSS